MTAMLVLDAAAMRRLDQLTMQSGASSGVELMERAGAGVARAMERRYGPLLGLRVLVLCGGGNNGGDGFVAARHLRARGARPDVVLLAKREQVKGDARAHLERLEAEAGAVRVALSEADVIAAVGARDGWDFALDALLGTGSRGEPEGLMAAGVEQLRLLDERGTRVVAVDLPTGVSSDNGAIARRAVRADLTVTFGATKIGHVLYPGAAFAGTLEVVDIGLVAPPAGDSAYQVELAGAEALSGLLGERDPRAYKGSAGRVLVIGGSPGLTGAVALAARAATRTGAGYVQMLVPSGIESVLAIQCVEQMTIAAPETEAHALSRAALTLAREREEAVDAVVLGSGLSRQAEALELARMLAGTLERPAVLDADALFALAGHGAELAAELAAAPAPRVLTPHLGEMARLTGMSAEAIEEDRISLARRFAREWGVVLVLKGAPTVTAAPDGRATVNASGNPGMATAGAGDVLAGVTAALLAAGLSAYDAARLGAYVHGLAGDLAARDIGPIGLAAGDIGERLPAALRELARRRDALAAKTIGPASRGGAGLRDRSGS
jgi:NAD(P)H-hydrate epimerase